MKIIFEITLEISHFRDSCLSKNQEVKKAKKFQGGTKGNFFRQKW
jgi:hypothetical protein